MLRPGLKPLKSILFTLDSMGGVWRYTLDLAQALQRENIACFGLGFGPRPGADQLEEAARAGMKLEWNALALDWQDGGVDALTQTRQEILTRAQRLQVDALHLDRLALPHRSLQVFPQVVTAHSCLPTWWQALRPSDEMPCVWKPAAAQNHEGLRACDHVIAPSEAHGKALRRAYNYVGLVTIIHNSARSFDVDPTVKEPVVVSAARWWDEAKNAACLDGAAARIDWPLIAIGPTRSSNNDGFTFHNASAIGPLSAGRVRTRMRGAAIFVSPSLYEPFGLATLEAALEGCALVLSHIATYRELWGDSTIYFDPRDPDALARAVNELIGDNRRLVENAKAAAIRARCFSPEKQTRKIIDVHRQTLNRFKMEAI